MWYILIESVFFMACDWLGIQKASIRLEKKTFFVVQTLDILEVQRLGAKFNQVGPLYEMILEFRMLDIVSLVSLF